MRVLVIGLICLLGSVVWGQEPAEERSRLVLLLEDTLSDGNAREVRIEGFQGALNSTASLTKLTIADADGIWLTITDAELVWTRSALLRGALEIDSLKAKRVELTRLPVSDAAAVSPEATPFALPELPVSVRLGALELEELALGVDVMGLALLATASGNADLAEGNGSAAFEITRLDGPEGQFTLAAAYDNATQDLDLSLKIKEDAKGVLATLANLPGAPALEFVAEGAGPLDDLTVDLDLSTDGVSRMAGEIVSTRVESGDQRISARVSGDLSALFLPEYQDFFGPKVSFEGDVVNVATGGVLVEYFAVTTAAMALTGAAELNADGQPKAFSLRGGLGRADQGLIRLPLSGSPVEVGAAKVDLRFDAAQGAAWDGQFSFRDLRTAQANVATGTLAFDGTIDPVDASSVKASVAAQLAGLALQDNALQAAIGSNAELRLLADWQRGDPLKLQNIRFSGDTASFTGDARITAADSKVSVGLEIDGLLPDLTPFSDVAGQRLSGALTAQLAGDVELLSGGFDVTLTAEGQDLSLAQPIADQLLAGKSTLQADVVRDENGLELRSLAVDSRELSAQAKGVLSSGPSRLNVTSELRRAAVISEALPGGVSLTAALSRAAEDMPWNVSAEAQGISGLRADVSGRIGLPNQAVALSAVGSLPLALSDPFVAPRSVRGVANFDLNVSGAPALASTSGTFTGRGLRLFDPSLGVSIDDVSVDGRIDGAQVQVSVDGTPQGGGTLSVNGSVDVSRSALPGSFDIALAGLRYQDADAFETEVDRGSLRLSGELAQNSQLSGQLILGQTDIFLEGIAFGSAEPIPEITHIGETTAQRATRRKAGLLKSKGSGSGPRIGLDLDIQSPSRIFIRGRGLDAELGGGIRIGGTSQDVVASGQFDLIRGRFILQGQRFDLSEASIFLRGSFDPYVRLVSSTTVEDTVISVVLEGLVSEPELRFESVPSLPEDEILARLLFGRASTSLSPVQALQLVDTISGLAGGKTLTSVLRKSLGVDDFDLTTDETGETQLRVGRYISENVYSDVEIGSGGDVELQLNLDLTPGLTARGSVSSEGDSSIGIFLERDY